MIETQALKKKRVVVTGGATGIGFAMANLFSQSGAKVAIGSRRDVARVHENWQGGHSTERQHGLIELTAFHGLPP